MRGFFGVGVYHPKTAENIGTLWRSAALFGADFIFTIGRRYKKQASDTTHATRHIPMFTYLTYEDFYAHMPYGARLVCVELAEDARTLHAMTHPQQAIYLLGAEDHGIPADIMQGQQVVQVPTLGPGSLNVAVVGSIVMYDRFVKMGV